MAAMLTKLPVINKMFDPGYQNFIALEGIWYKNGCEKYLHALFETACSMHGFHAAVLWLDEKNPVAGTIRKLGKLGIISKLMRPGSVDIRVKFNGYSEEEKKVYYDRPAYTSCFDMT